MKLLLIRHGQAVDEAPGLGDDGRWLTATGRKVTRRVAAWLARRRSTPVQIWTSPLVRAVQTAEILAAAIGLEDGLCAVPTLVPAADPEALRLAVSRFQGDGPLALVGHEPLLSLLATSLLGNVDWPGIRKSGVVGLRWSGEGRAELLFLLKPKNMEVIRALPRPA
jgi:phosphohistidine phosphatase